MRVFKVQHVILWMKELVGLWREVARKMFSPPPFCQRFHFRQTMPMMLNFIIRGNSFLVGKLHASKR